MLNWLQNKYIYNTISPGHGVPPVTWWGTESQAPASRSAACWTASLQVGEPQRRTLRLRAALHQASRRSGGQPHLQAMALHSCSRVGVNLLWGWMELGATLWWKSAMHPLIAWYDSPTTKHASPKAMDCTETLYRRRTGQAAGKLPGSKRNGGCAVPQQMLTTSTCHSRLITQLLFQTRLCGVRPICLPASNSACSLRAYSSSADTAAVNQALSNMLP